MYRIYKVGGSRKQDESRSIDHETHTHEPQSFSTNMGSLDRFLGIDAARTRSRSRSGIPMNHSHQTLEFRPAPNNPNTTIVARTGPNATAFPLFTFTKSKKSKPNLFVHRIGAGIAAVPQTLVGDATYHTLESSVSLTLHGQLTKMKLRDSMDGYKFEHAVGKFKWKSDSIAANAMALSDGGGMTLARFQVGERLDILVPCEDLFLDLVVVSGLAAAAMKAKDAKNTEIIGEVIGGLAGG